uniref:Uveal autoantigen with coiled-coil domains and ankyrin repeats n=1 Tax=Anthurium amnicola TaxID=1678845 RepID=A0A1D1YID4_9ARAE
MAMATSSPVQSSSNNAASVAPPTPNGSSIAPQRSSSFEMPKQSLRGIKKPKCIKCGNIARSRCPFQSCKSCCAKAQNPCHIHVLKVNGTLPDKPPPASSPLPEQTTNDMPSLSGAAMRLSSLRQLSSTFINSLRTRKPLSRKDAAYINKWRFSKLKEHIEGNIEAENEAFDRYMKNVSLLEETFSVNSWNDSMPIVEACSSEEDFNKLVTGIKARLKSNSERANNFRERVQGIVDRGLQKLKEWEFQDNEVSQADDTDSFGEFKRRRKILKSRFEMTAAVEDLAEKLIKARSEDDLKSCLETKLQLFNQDGHCASHKSNHPTADDTETKESTDTVTAAFSYSLPKLLSTVQISENSLSNIDREFISLDQIAEL